MLYAYRSFSRSLLSCVGNPYKSQCSDRNEPAGGWIHAKVGLIEKLIEGLR